MNIASVLLAGVILGGLSAQSPALSSDPLAPRPNGMQSATPSRHLIVNATIHTAPGSMIEDADILIDNGRIVQIGSNIAPGSATVWDIDGAHIYAGFIDPYIEVAAPAPSSSSTGLHWSSRVTPQKDALDIGIIADQSKALREMGFTTAMIAPDSGIFRGWSSIVSTAQDFEDDSLGNPPVYQTHTGQMMGFDRGGWGDDTYPTSHMGVVALMRQTFIDATHRKSTPRADASCLDEIHPNDTTLFYNTSHELEALLADNIASELDHQRLVLIDNGSAHRRLDAYKDMAYPVIVPLNFPETPEVASIGAADSVDLATLQHWERAPANARWLSNSGIQVALTTSKLRSGEKFWDNLHTAIEKGLSPYEAHAMMSINPANILGLKDQGTIAPNNIANLVVASGDLFDPKSKAQIIDTWVDGRRHHINDPKNEVFDGDWTISLVGMNFNLNMSIEGKKISITAGEGDTAFETEARKVSIDHNQISFLSQDAPDGSGIEPGFNVITGVLSPGGVIRGSGLSPTQQPFQWTATKNAKKVTLNDFKGTWNATLANQFKLDFKIAKDKVTIIEQAQGKDDIEQTASTQQIDNGVLTFTFEHEPFGMAGTFTIGLNTPTKENNIDALTGIGTLPDGKPFAIIATKESKNDDDSVHTLPDLPDTPFGPFSYDQEPAQNTYLLSGATIWTQSDDGIIQDGWVLITDGKISSVGGKNRPSPRVREENYIDATGMHITPGLIDAHSHTGLFRFGVNESGQAVTAECRISDSLDPGHPGFYRELAGGLTTANLLHGSANPIGGQSKTIKLRWNSATPSDMFFEGAKPGIKFALGENVKQSNWGDRNTSRYPQTRMGVETLMRDRFSKAREYAAIQQSIETRREGGELNWQNGVRSTEEQQKRNRLNEQMSGFSRDLELETLAQVLAGDRLVHCHSYRQDEILMLCRIAEEFGFKIGTFQHGLETYKVAEIVKEHAIGASIFSDWWAYKAEVVDAIPFAGPINHEVGLLTSFNSDSDDVARRMNVEAGKALKYAKLSGIKLSEQDALNFVTLNPAIQLGISDRVGSLESGKDADVVVWTGNPLSSLSRAEMTFVDGRLYFSRDLDAHLLAKNTNERQRLIQLILRDGKSESQSEEQPEKNEVHHDHGDDLVDPEPDMNHTHFNTNRGDCGCSQLLPAFNTDY